MDRSFLSQPDVVEASRDFVCIRLATYENKEEAEFTRNVCRTASGELENTAFTILAPDGKTQLIRGERSPKKLFASAKDLAREMNRIAVYYFDSSVLGAAKSPLPKIASVRLGVNIASGDNVPLVLIYAPTQVNLASLEERVRKQAWSKEFLGKFVYATTTQPNDLKLIAGIKPAAGVYVIQADKFGQKGTVLQQVLATSDDAALIAALNTGYKAHTKYAKSHFEHVRAGAEAGVFWTTALPVSDPLEEAARQRTKAKIEREKQN